MGKKIRIECKGERYIPLHELSAFQGELKTLDPAAVARLSRLILKYGFSFPVFTWRKHILDGHQRLHVVRELVREGYTIGKIPCVEIAAKNRQEAAEKLLAASSRFGRVTEKGLSAFLAENAVNFPAISGDFQLPDIDIEKFLESWGPFEAPGALGGVAPAEEIPDSADAARVVMKSIPAFMGAYCLHQAKENSFPALAAWKKDPAKHKQFQREMIEDFIRAIEKRRNHFDFVSVPPPNAKRETGYLDYPVAAVAETVAAALSLPFLQVFEQRKRATGHGVGARLHQVQERFAVIPGLWDGRGAVCLLIDDVCTTRFTLSECQRALSACRVACFALAWCYWGNV